MTLNMDHRHVIVTGGTGALGSSVATLLIKAGGHCSIPCFDKSELHNFNLEDHDRVFLDTDVDLTSEQATQNFYRRAIDEQGDLWASVHIAGGFGMGAIEDTPLADFNRQFQMNTATCYNSCRTAVHWIRKASGGGRIVNIAAQPALEPRQGKGMTAYTVAKAGVAALTQSLAAEVIEEDILVNAIAPSIIDTPDNREAMSSADYSKWPTPSQLARQIGYLVSPENEVTRGAVIPVYGKS